MDAILKYRLRAFSFGLLFAAGIMGIYIYFLSEKAVEKIPPPTLEEAKKIVIEHNYIVLTKEEFTQLQGKENKNVNEKSKKEKAPKAQVNAYTLVVTTGMSTSDIASLLKKNGIIHNKQDFIDFMAVNGYSKSIQVGSYQLTNKMNFAEIASLLTKG